MPRYTITRNWIDCIGPLWMGGTAAKQIDLRAYDLESMRDDDGAITKDSIERWLCLNEHDFRCVSDFAAYITDGEQEIEVDWADGESEFTFSDCMYPCEN